MGDLIYHDILDTVRTPELKCNENENSIRHLAASNLMLSLILGENPVLSQTQAFDSSVILGTLQSSQEKSPFISLVRRKFIRVKLFRQPSLLSAFKAALNNDKFIFSGWPEIEQGKVERKAIIKRLDGDMSSSLPDSVISKISALEELNAANDAAHINEPAELPSVSLADLISFSHTKAPEDLKGILLKLDALKTNDRSLHYKAIDEMRENEFQKEIARDVVNMCYNKVISTSLGAKYVTLTGRKLISVEAIRNALQENLRSRDPFTSSETFGLQSLTWCDAEKFVTDHEVYDRQDMLREAFAAKFLATFYSPSKGIAFLPNLSGSAFKCTVVGVSSIVGVLYPETLPIVVGSVLATLFGEAEIKNGIRNKQLSKYTKMYEGILQRKKG